MPKGLKIGVKYPLDTVMPRSNVDGRENFPEQYAFIDSFLSELSFVEVSEDIFSASYERYISFSFRVQSKPVNIPSDFSDKDIITFRDLIKIQKVIEKRTKYYDYTTLTRCAFRKKKKKVVH